MIESQYPGSLPSPAKKVPHNICKIEFHNLSVWYNNLTFEKKHFKKMKWLLFEFQLIDELQKYEEQMQRRSSQLKTRLAVFVKLERRKNSSFFLNMSQITRTYNSVVLGKLPTKLPVWSHKGSQLPHDHCELEHKSTRYHFCRQSEFSPQTFFLFLLYGL